MSAYLSQKLDKWYEAIYSFLADHRIQGVSLMIDGCIIRSSDELEKNLEYAVDYLERSSSVFLKIPDSTEDISKINAKLHTLGFLKGWGNSRKRILETMKLLQETLEQPNEVNLEEFMTRIPMVSKVAVISPHGWFGQTDVLGRPDTGGQVVYILDQVKALEKKIVENLKCAGIDLNPKIIIVTRLIPENEGTSSNIPKEKVHNTQNSWIIRVPFKDATGNILPQWLSRFHIWPYLDQFAVDSMHEICSELSGKPDLIIGNYSDGNLVATLIANNLGTIQCNIAHALEKPKYLFSDLYWDNFEDNYHFSLQFVADMISVNQANIIISSTSQEITGNDRTIGQYESYKYYTMPGLMHIVGGVNIFHHKFNVIPPGVNQEVFFPFHRKEKRLKQQTTDLSDLLFVQENKDTYGTLENPDLPPIMTISRLDRIKNISGLVETYGQSKELKRRANLILIAGTLYQNLSRDEEEAAEIARIYSLIEQYRLNGHIRWLGIRLPASDAGEVYRIIGDRRGVFVQPALFEGFGLTVLEAMHSGLPVFATRFGGPLEIIQDGQDGFLINPTDQTAVAKIIVEFLKRAKKTKGYWHKISTRAIDRAQSRFTWSSYCDRLLHLANIYSFWKHYKSKNIINSKISNYCDLLYHLYFKPRAAEIKGE
jgi:sucrose synthase